MPSSGTGLYPVYFQERFLGFLSLPVLASVKRYQVPRAGLELRSRLSIRLAQHQQCLARVETKVWGHADSHELDAGTLTSVPSGWPYPCSVIAVVESPIRA